MSTFITRWSRPRDDHFDYPERRTSLVDRTDNTGICFSGGGTRAQCAAVGQLRALTDLGLLDGVRYISSVSGGSWGTTPLLWGSPDRSDETLLGPITPPEQLDPDTLAGPLPADGILVTATVNLDAALRAQHQADTPASRRWTEAVGAVYLAPFGLHDADHPAYFTATHAEQDAITARNPALAGARFVRSRAPDRLPYHIINSCMIGPTDLEPFTDEAPLSYEATPLYSGNPYRRQQLFFSRDGRWAEACLGGGYIESFAVGSPSLEAVGDDDTITVQAPARPFTLADAVGMSSAAYAGVTATLGTSTRGLASRTPSLTTWSKEPGAAPTTMAMGDGGVLENYGLLTLLRRKVERVVVFINTSTALDLDYDPAARVPESDQLDSFLPPLFGFSLSSLGTALQSNHVFSGADWVPLVRALQDARRHGRPVTHRMRHTVLPNLVWGIEGGFEVEVLWCYLERVDDWEDRLPDEVEAAVDRGHRWIFKGDYAHFPHYKTAGQDSLADVHLSPEQARLLADFTCEVVRMDPAPYRALLDRKA